MFDLLDDFRLYFEGLGLANTGQVFLDMAPDKPDTLISLNEYEGSSDVQAIGTALRSVQIVTRALDPMEARILAWNLYRALQVEDGILQLTGERWALVFLRQNPFKFKVDTQDRTYFCFNIGVRSYND